MQQSSQSFPALPESFIFGVATADHQCEAYDANYEDIRDLWEQRCHLTLRGRATDFWNRYAEDIALAQSLGCKAFRFSLAWSRLEPEPGRFNDEAFAHYQRLIETIRAAGMEPIMTLHHFTWPIHVEQRQGLIGEDFPTIFVNYVTEVVNRLGHLVRYWITFNEPSQLIYGYIKPWWEQSYAMPPGLPPQATLANQLEAVAKLMRNLFRAHTYARQAIKRSNPTAMVGVNPMILGLPAWLQRWIDRNITTLRTPDDWQRQGRRFADRGQLEHGKVDAIIATFTATAERARQVDFSEVYYVSSQALLVRTETSIRAKEDLVGQTVAVIQSSTAEDTLKTLLPASGVRVVKTLVEALHALDTGQVAAILADKAHLQGLMQPAGRYLLLSDHLPAEPYAVAVTKGDPALLAVIDSAIQRFKAQRAPAQATSQPSHFPRRATLSDINGMTFARQAEQDQTSRRKTQLARIKERGHLVVAVKEDVPGLGYRDPQTGELSGLEIDLARAIAMEIFGDPGKVVFRPVHTHERLPMLRSSLLRLLDPLCRLYSIFSTALTSNWWHLGMAGKLQPFLCPPECVGQQDFVGLDYYWGTSTLGPHRILQLMETSLFRYNRAPVWPEGLYGILKYHAQLFPGKEILLIENGCVDKADDRDRAVYISQHVRQVQRARRDGINIMTYICWSITSNREWGMPFGPASDFGLYHIDLDTDAALKRTPTPAVEVYRKIIEKRGNQSTDPL